MKDKLHKLNSTLFTSLDDKFSELSPHYTPTEIVADEVKYYKLFPTCQIRNSKIIRFNKLETNYNKLLDNSHFLKAKESIKYSGVFTQSARKNMRRAIDIMLQCNPKHRVYNDISKKWIYHTISFLTLTIPTYQELTPKYTNKFLLQPLLEYLRKSHNLKFYVWKLEYQMRGQIHYHITFPNWINYYKIQNKWNDLLYKNKLMNEYIEKYKNVNPPSIDIAKVKHIKDFGAYLEKEFNKSCQNNNEKQKLALENYYYIQKFNEENKHTPNFQKLIIQKPESFKIWDCSINLKSNKFFSTEETEELDYQLINHLAYNNENATFKWLEHCRIDFVGDNYINNILVAKTRFEYEDWKKKILNYKRKSQSSSVRQPV